MMSMLRIVEMVLVVMFPMMKVIEPLTAGLGPLDEPYGAQHMLGFEVAAMASAVEVKVLMVVVWRWMVRRWSIEGRAAGLRLTLRNAGGDMYATVGVGHGTCRMAGRCLLRRSRAPRPSLLGEALGLAGSGGRGQAFWARRCQQNTYPASRSPPSGGALGRVVLCSHNCGGLLLEPFLGQTAS